MTEKPLSPYRAGLLCKCPKCGEGAIFQGPLVTGNLALVDQCDKCGFDLTAADPGDGAQVFVIFILGALSAILGAILYVSLALPTWLLLTILFIVVLVAAVWMLRVIKATFVALQFHHDAHEGALSHEDDQ